jgi:hypothetical protein
MCSRQARTAWGIQGSRWPFRGCPARRAYKGWAWRARVKLWGVRSHPLPYVYDVLQIMFRAGKLADLEDIRESALTVIITKMQVEAMIRQTLNG